MGRLIANGQGRGADNRTGIEGVRWSRPEGGFFLWVTLPEGPDTDRLLEEAIREKVTLVPGSCRLATGGTSESTRRPLRTRTCA